MPKQFTVKIPKQKGFTSMKFDTRLFFYLTAGFIIATAFGTFTHELGHYSIAKYLGYDAYINYKSTHFSPDQNMSQEHEFWIVLGGPALTILAGTIGFAIILIYRKSYRIAEKLSPTQWFLIFIALFWLRQLSNFTLQLFGYFRNGEFSSASDEMKLDRYLNFQPLSISTASALCALGVLITICFKFIPANDRFTFILAGIIGGFSGYYLWMQLIGKLILP